MTCSRRQLLWGLCVIMQWLCAAGVRYLPEQAYNFTKCSPTSDVCPQDSSCAETKLGYYCACDNGFYNARDQMTITYPGGQCTVICSKDGSSSGCVCQSGYIKKKNDKDLFFCTDKCTEDDDCPSGATCQGQACYCPRQHCVSKRFPTCFNKIRLNEQCTAPNSTTQPTKPTQGTTIMEMRTTTTTTMVAITTTTPKTTTETTTPTTTTTTIQSTPWRAFSVPTPQMSEPENRRCELLISPELNECEISQSQDAFCTLLRENARIQGEICQTNEVSISIVDVAQEFTNVLNHVALTNLTTSERRSAVTSIVTSVENTLLEMFSKDLQDQNISTPELEVQTKLSRDECTGASTVTLTVLENTMRVPCSHVSGDTDGAILISYKGLGALGEADQEDTEEINSPIVSGSITSPNLEYLEPPVAFYLKQLKVVPASYTVRCVFWDIKEELWSSHGCETKISDRENCTLCVCNHLSTFAVLMAPSDIQEDDALILISRIGLSVSLTCLCLSMLTFTMCRSIRSAHTSVLTALCGCLFVGQLLVLFGLHQTGNKVLCAVIAGLLQFSFLCAFCWMSLESALLFMTVRNLQAMNYMTSQRSHLPYVCLTGFGIPLIIIIVSAAMRPDGYGTEKYCWLHLDLVWSFLGPVCALTTINFILLVLTFALLRKKMASLNSSVSTIKHTRLLTFKALSQLFILGCTWIFGIFQFGSSSLVMSYIFTICNSLQGLYIFCVHCLLNRQVWKEYMTGFNKFHSKKSELDTLSGNTVPTTLKQQMGHTHQTLPNQEKIYENLMCRQLSPAYSQEPGVRGLPERQFVNFNPKIPPKMVPGLTQARAEFLQ